MSLLVPGVWFLERGSLCARSMEISLTRSASKSSFVIKVSLTAFSQSSHVSFPSALSGIPRMTTLLRHMCPSILSNLFTNRLSSISKSSTLCCILFCFSVIVVYCFSSISLSNPLSAIVVYCFSTLH